MDRRTFLAAIAAGGVITAAGLWMPGQKLISIPKSGQPTGVYRYDISYHSFGTSEIWTAEPLTSAQLEDIFVRREAALRYSMRQIS